MAMNRLYVVESSPSITGSMADHRLPLASSQVEGVARRLLTAILNGTRDANRSNESDDLALWVEAATADLQAVRGKSIVIAGEHQPSTVHALAHLLNSELGNVGTTVFYTDRVEAIDSLHGESIRSLTSAMKNGEVELLLLLDTNPAFTAPADLGFADALKKVKFAAHLSSHFDETSMLCDWHVPMAHPLESWSDIRAWDGTVSIIQPLIEPLYGGRTAHEVLDALSEAPPRSAFKIVQEHWRTEKRWPDFDKGWERTVHDGLIAGSELKPVEVTVQADARAKLLKPAPAASSQPNTLEVSFRPDPSIWDGRFANNAWLQELPRPITKLTWDNALLLSPAMAAKHKLNTGDVVSVEVPSGQIKAPVLVTPGQAERTLTIHLGYGRKQSGHVGNDVGFDAYPARSTATQYWAPASALIKTGKQHPFAITQSHRTLSGRDIVRETTLHQYQEGQRPATMGENEAPLETLYRSRKPLSPDYAWGMVIDLNTCIGCNACIVACQAENNIPVVGKDQVRRSREMHWIRIDTYFRGNTANPDMTHQPLPCVHCENAPCELVCPVEATVHDSEGLNLQVYNRCVGTRYCSNNCPYKVRRFNFLQYANQKTPVLQLLFNPAVTVRTRGVMEKCTYCIQRISHARITADKEGRLIRDHEIQTACQQSCPTEAIVFGNLRDPQAEVTPLRSHPLNYALLGELNTRPRTTYLARVRNPKLFTAIPAPA